MDIYLETNFILELALMQEQYESCEQIVQLAEEQKIRLIIPAFSLAEPYETLIRHAKRREEARKNLEIALKQLSRSPTYLEKNVIFQEITTILGNSSELENNQLQNTLSKLVQLGIIIPLTAEIFIAALAYQTELELSPPDSLVYASIIQHLQQSTINNRCFINKNSRIFWRS